MLTPAQVTVELVIFDCDGVLIDSETISARTLAQTLTEAGLAMTTLEVQRAFTGMSDGRMFDELARRGLADREALAARWRETLYAAFRSELREMDGIGTVVRSLTVAKCVASNSSIDRLKHSLGIVDIWDMFAPHVYSAEMVSRPKPAPDLIEKCLKTFGVRPERAVVVDDSAQGIAAATAAGVAGIGFLGATDPRPDQRAALEAAGARAVVSGAAGLGRYLANDLHVTSATGVSA